jgi:hypothetical protein
MKTYKFIIVFIFAWIFGFSGMLFSQTNDSTKYTGNLQKIEE